MSLKNSVSVKTKVRHRNGINSTLSNMPLAARRVLFLAMIQFDPKHIIKKDSVFKVTASDYAAICDIDNSKAYGQLRDAAKQLQQQLIAIPKEQLLPPIYRPGEKPWVRPEGKGVRMMNITEYCDYEEGSGFIEISFSRQMEPYICKLEKDYTTQFLISSVRLNDTNAMRIYQYLREKIGKGKTEYIDILVDDLKNDLGVDDVETYESFKYFNDTFFKRSVKQIIKKTEFNSIEMVITERLKRKAHKVRIIYSYDK